MVDHPPPHHLLSCDFSQLQNSLQQSQQFLENEKLGVNQKAPVVVSSQECSSGKTPSPLGSTQSLETLMIATTSPASPKDNCHCL